jgi:hypothetical protein
LALSAKVLAQELGQQVPLQVLFLQAQVTLELTGQA